MSDGDFSVQLGSALQCHLGCKNAISPPNPPRSRLNITEYTSKFQETTRLIARKYTSNTIKYDKIDPAFKFGEIEYALEGRIDKIIRFHSNLGNREETRYNGNYLPGSLSYF